MNRWLFYFMLVIILTLEGENFYLASVVEHQQGTIRQLMGPELAPSAPVITEN